MLTALGYSQGSFSPADPGRLCRGRERWIDPHEQTDPPVLHRLVVSGACFSDDSARDANRGLRFSGITPGVLLRNLFPDAVLVASAEDTHPRTVPPDAQDLEHYELRRPGGPLVSWGSRWMMSTETEDDVDRAVSAGADVFLVRSDPLPPPDPDQVAWTHDAPLVDSLGHERPPMAPERLRQDLFLLTGSRVAGAPARLFQPAAMMPMLEWCDALVLLHEDKHAPCVAIYTPEPTDLLDRLMTLSGTAGTLPVPFAIPPMLARWDRALWELRQSWDEALLGPFPVPAAPEASYGRRRRARPHQRRHREE